MTGCTNSNSGKRRYTPNKKGGAQNFSSKNPMKKKTLDDYLFYVGTSKQAADYENTAEFIINHVKRTFDRGNDIAEMLRNCIKPNTDNWKPNLQISTSTDADIKTRKDKEFAMIFKAELDEFIKRKRALEENMFKVYALLWEKCAKSLQNKILARRDFETTIYNKPIALLQAIKEHSLNYQESRYNMSIITDALKAAMNLKQRDNENLHE